MVQVHPTRMPTSGKEKKVSEEEKVKRKVGRPAKPGVRVIGKIPVEVYQALKTNNASIGQIIEKACIEHAKQYEVNTNGKQPLPW